MKTESLHALIIDHHLGELSQEAAELLEHHLAANTQARTEAERILQSLDATREAVMRHPELARAPVGRMWRQPARLLECEESGAHPQRTTADRTGATVVPPQASHTQPRIAKKNAPTPWMARAAAIALLAGGGGFFAGRSHTPPAPEAMMENAPKPRQQSPWAQYRMTLDPAGAGVQVVRVDTEKLEAKSLR